ncbi:MAG: hypothetical protein ACPLVI_06320 [Thermoplasmata archaeon]|uniref:hypothetical protein n=1 Tax=Caldisericum sp. TaxID=2499687 RepID=UPI003C808420
MPEKPILILKKIKEGYSNKGILMKTSLILFYDFLLTIKIMFIENVRTLSLFESKELCLIIKDLFDNNTFILNYFGFTIKKFDELLKYMNYDFNILILLLNPLYILNEFFNFTNDQFTLDNARKIINDNCIIYLNDKLKFFINKNNFQLIKLINNILNIDSLY